jgi:transcriptional regulator with GAF, ATPase, and Fis domain
MRNGTVDPFHPSTKRIILRVVFDTRSAFTYSEPGPVSDGAKRCLDLKLRTTLVTTPIRTSSEVEALFGEANRDDRLPAPAGTEGSTTSGGPQAPRITTLRSVCAQFERDYITAVLEQHDWRVPDVARALGVDPANLYRKMRRLHISRA